jgi:uncharacterized protein (TIGR00251 family)
MAELPPWLRIDEVQMSIAVHVQPGARRTAIVGVHGERLKIAVRARATAGRANTALIEVIAAALRQAPSSIRIAAGAASRDKRLVAPRGTLPADEIVRRLSPK